MHSELALASMFALSITAKRLVTEAEIHDKEAS
jgi:hypothetical protein